MQTKHWFYSRDVKFYEHIIPFSKQNVHVSPFFNEHMHADDMSHEPSALPHNYQLSDTNNNDDITSELNNIALVPQSQDDDDLVFEYFVHHHEEQVYLPQETTYALRRFERITRDSV